MMQADQLSICYQSKIPVSISKKAALVNYGGKDIIPEKHHGYSMDLPTDSSKKDRITCPGSDEEAEALRKHAHAIYSNISRL